MDLAVDPAVQVANLGGYAPVHQLYPTTPHSCVIPPARRLTSSHWNLKEDRPSAFQVCPQWTRVFESAPAFYRNESEDGDERKKQEEPDHPAGLLDASQACIATFSSPVAPSQLPRSSIQSL
ncbi:hypothetical protein B0H13DRAFT_2394940 [Mycena leptocephala]|nr:hypothetical protein B0H13DRAFT_2394940 [Mycena leptocephala]